VGVVHVVGQFVDELTDELVDLDDIKLADGVLNVRGDCSSLC